MASKLRLEGKKERALKYVMYRWFRFKNGHVYVTCPPWPTKSNRFFSDKKDGMIMIDHVLCRKLI